VNNQVQRVYKNLWPSIRDFWLFVSSEFKERAYVVFEGQRWTYGQISERVDLAARVFHVMYGIRKGDRIAICSRNFPDFLVAFWACHVIGAVSVLVNAYVNSAYLLCDFLLTKLFSFLQLAPSSGSATLCRLYTIQIDHFGPRAGGYSRAYRCGSSTPGGNYGNFCT
jgi:AMP-binding enzyme